MKRQEQQGNSTRRGADSEGIFFRISFLHILVCEADQQLLTSRWQQELQTAPLCKAPLTHRARSLLWEFVVHSLECDHCHTGTGCPIWQGKIRCCWYSEKLINLLKMICCCKLQNSKIQKSHLFWHIRVELTNCIDKNTGIYISVIFQCKTWTGSCLARRKPFPMHTGRVNGKGIFIGELICFCFCRKTDLSPQTM